MISRTEQANSYFIRIGDGHKHAVKRPVDENVDRALRSMIEFANHNGDCIIPRTNGDGYYRPIPTDEIDSLEYNIYMSKERSRRKSMLEKEICMEVAYENRRAKYEIYDTRETG